MGHAPEYISNILAKIQYIQDLYSKHFNLSITLIDQEGKSFMIPSGTGLYCYQTCTDRTACNRFNEKLLLRARKQSEPIFTNCPQGLRAAAFPLGLCLETNTTAKPDVILLIRDSEAAFKKELNPAGSLLSLQSDELQNDKFIETAQLIANNLDMIFSLVKLQGISLDEKKVLAKEEHAKLTEREKEIAHLIGNGMSNSEIAGSLYISEHTVKVHVSNILKKLQLNNRTKLALYKIQAL